MYTFTLTTQQQAVCKHVGVGDRQRLMPTSCSPTAAKIWTTDGHAKLCMWCMQRS